MSRLRTFRDRPAHVHFDAIAVARCKNTVSPGRLSVGMETTFGGSHLVSAISIRPRTASDSCRAFCAQPHTRKSIRLGGQCRKLVCRAAAETDEEQSGSSAAPPEGSAQDATSGNFVPVCKPEEVPKGFRKEVKVDGVEVLLLWYRNKVYAIEARSPAEGAYSEGFMNARLNQEYCIACPSTGTTFSLQTGEIKDWYPANPVLRAITPQNTCRKLDVFPVKVSQEAISVDVSSASVTASSPAGKGGSDTSIDANNVFGVESRPYYEAQDPITGEYDQEAANRVNPYVISVSLFAVVFAGVAGSAFALYKESYIGLAILWVGIIAVAAYSVLNFTPVGNKK